jgi:hypothetical protein
MKKNLRVIDSQKPKLIKTELSSEPFKILNAPEYIRNNEEYQNIAIEKMPALEPIIKNNNWDLAIKKDPKLILYAPETIDNWENRVLDYLTLNKHSIDIPKRLRDNQNLMIAYLEENPSALQYIKDQTPEMCLSAVKRFGFALSHVKDQTDEICLAAVEQTGYALQLVKNQTEEICLAAVKNDKSSLQYVRDPELKHKLELYLAKETK